MTTSVGRRARSATWRFAMGWLHVCNPHQLMCSSAIQSHALYFWVPVDRHLFNARLEEECKSEGSSGRSALIRAPKCRGFGFSAVRLRKSSELLIFSVAISWKDSCEFGQNITHRIELKTNASQCACTTLRGLDATNIRSCCRRSYAVPFSCSE